MLTGPCREMVCVVPSPAPLLPCVVLRDADIRLTVHPAPFVTCLLVYGTYWTAGRLRRLGRSVPV
jgi:hypothetical protein